jgi:hypothetical protein
MGKEQIARLVRENGAGAATAEVKSDFEAAAAIQQGTADYYIGACQSGAGGALAVATAILGPAKVARLSGVGTAGVSLAAVQEALDSGKRAFGVAHAHIDAAVPVIMEAILAKAQA